MTERNYAIDFIRLVAILAVVTIHIGSAFLDRLTVFSPSFYFIYGVNLAVRFGVPLFFCISGYLLAARYADIKSPLLFYKKRAFKIVPPYIIWCLIYFFLVFPPKSEITSAKFLTNLLTGDFSYQLYFIPAIILLYLIFPLLILTKRIFLKPQFIILLAVLEVVILAFMFIKNDNAYISSPLKHAAYNLLPFLIGMYLAINKIDIYAFVKKRVAIIFALAFALWMMIFYESYIHMKDPSTMAYLKNYWKVNVLFYGVTIGGLFYYVFERFLKNYGTKIAYVSRYSFGVFFVHVAIVQIFLKHVIDPLELYSVFYYFATLGIIITASFAFSIILSRVKFAGKLLGLKG
jgi:surface polysaccharide O-acyltransferase-like enzyme